VVSCTDAFLWTGLFLSPKHHRKPATYCYYNSITIDLLTQNFGIFKTKKDILATILENRNSKLIKCFMVEIFSALNFLKLEYFFQVDSFKLAG